VSAATRPRPPRVLQRRALRTDGYLFRNTPDVLRITRPGQRMVGLRSCGHAGSPGTTVRGNGAVWLQNLAVVHRPGTVVAVERSAVNRPVVVVSGSSGGIGRPTCQAFIDAGFSVFGIDIAEPPPIDRWFTSVRADVTKPEELAVMLACADLPPVSHVVTLAGIAHPAEPDAHLCGTLIGPEVFRQSVELNLGGHFNVLHATLPYLDQSAGDRSVAFVSSINALRGFGLPAYSAAKAGLSGLVWALTPFLGARGIRVNVVLPGTTPTPATLDEWSSDPDHFGRLAAAVPLGRLGSPSDVAETLVALCRLRHVTGQELVVDGGQSVSPPA
jgi:NAD(P)-dependent dehydrogenase (short-subunit alcohol dehydrogenase family)